MSLQDQLLERYCQEFPAGAVLFRGGDEGHQMYVVQSGKVRISVTSAEVDKTLAMLGPGEFFGEMAVLNNRPRTAAATVVDNSQLLVIDKEKFEELVKEHSELALRLIRRLADRLEKTDRNVEILLHREPRARVILGLSDYATSRGQNTPNGVLIDVSPDEIAEYVGLEPAVTRDALRRLERLELVAPAGVDAVMVRDIEGLQRFLSYLELKEKYGD
jgi:CRP/FNR family transcriptional regulator, cyclic AMP receptor protein